MPRKDHIRRSFACCLAAIVVAVPTLAWAADTAMASDQTLRALLPVVALLGIATALALLELRRRRRKLEGTESEHPALAALPLGSHEHNDDATLHAQASSLHEMPSSVMSTGELEIATSEPAVAPQLIDGLVDESERFFVAGPARLEDSLDTDTAHMACPECDRAYEMGTRHCPFDGALLHMREETAQDHAIQDVVMVCPECASEHEPDALYCPDDHARLIARTQGDEPDRLGHAPMLVCLGCAQELPSTAQTCTHCEDAGQLRFMHGRKTAGLWFDAGPYTRICGDCGRRYGEGMSYCSVDGSELLRLN